MDFSEFIASQNCSLRSFVKHLNINFHMCAVEKGSHDLLPKLLPDFILRSTFYAQAADLFNTSVKSLRHHGVVIEEDDDDDDDGFDNDLHRRRACVEEEVLLCGSQGGPAIKTEEEEAGDDQGGEDHGGEDHGGDDQGGADDGGGDDLEEEKSNMRQ